MRHDAATSRAEDRCSRDPTFIPLHFSEARAGKFRSDGVLLPALGREPNFKHETLPIKWGLDGGVPITEAIAAYGKSAVIIS